MESMLKESRVAAIYDIHGNLPALEAVLSDLEPIEPGLLIVGGDVASGPMPAEVLDRLAGLGTSSASFAATRIGKSFLLMIQVLRRSKRVRSMRRFACLDGLPRDSRDDTATSWPRSQSG